MAYARLRIFKRVLLFVRFFTIEPKLGVRLILCFNLEHSIFFILAKLHHEVSKALALVVPPSIPQDQSLDTEVNHKN